MSTTNETTKQILNYLFEQGVFAWRQNTVGIPTQRGWRPAAKTVVADILAVLPGGKFMACEVKTNKDRLRPEQIGFLKNVESAGGVALIIKDFEDFRRQYDKSDI